MTHTLISGALVDARTPEAKARDWHQHEILAALASVQWIEKPQSALRRFPIFDQDSSGSCVAQTEAKELGIMRYLTDGVYVHFSATDIYQRRANRPAPGMGADDARQILQGGTTLEALSPSQNMGDGQMDGALVEPYKREVGAVFAVPNYLALAHGDIDAIASTIQATGKGVMLWFYFKYDEWTDTPTIKHSDLVLGASTTLHHSVTAVDFSLRGNDKVIFIEDSWGDGAGVAGQRFITEGFLKARNYYAGYLVNFRFQDAPTPKPEHIFLEDLWLGTYSDEVRALQDCLRYDGEFPANADSTGYYGPVTQTAVQKFQVKHGIAAPGELGYGRVGPKTRAMLNLIFAP